MIEHRLIERMISVIEKTLGRIDDAQEIDPLFVDKAVDVYANVISKSLSRLFRHTNPLDPGNDGRL